MWKKPWYYATLNNYNRENVSPLKTNFCRTINVIIKIHLHIQAIYIHSHIVMRSIIIYSLAARMCKFWCVLTIGFLLINVSNGNQNKNFLSEEDKRGAINEIDSKSKRDLPIASGSSKRYYGDYDSNRYGGSGYPHTSGLGNYGDDRRPSTYYEDDYHHSGGGGYSRPSYGSGYGPPPVYHHGGGYEDDHYYNEHQVIQRPATMNNNLLVICSLLLFLCTVQARNQCFVTKFEDVANATKNCQNILVGNLTVPAGKTLVLDLLPGATVNFIGNVTFGFENWVGPLMRVYGNNVTVQGEDGHIINGQGELYWDDLGSWGTLKPKFMIVQANASVFKNLHLYHAPMHGVAINNSHNVVFTNFLIDNAAGAENVAPLGHAGHNTDGFGVNMSTNVVIKDSRVYNQDDCVVLNSGSNIHVTNMLCYGSHGLSLSVGFSNDSVARNSLTNALIENSTIIDAMDGIHVKTHIDAGVGEVTNVTYRNIVMLGSYKFGISVEQNYTNTKSAGKGAIPLNNIPITGLNMYNIKGTVQNKAQPYYIVCAQDGCLDWDWDDISVYGEKESSCVNLHPDAISCTDYVL
ncbi:unnamed protein product [Ceutorhynchus assimilis]|uniref:endo-polygalacturonase n=1 Tax=Ceutorhynchus assimilis TaxID=467358 RepID=A0A9N9QIV3_9CUCU|nr:unnamed protein product [Ceutorhynchus assimilis]